MIGAITGDVAGSRFERRNIKTTEFELMHEGCRFTDDTVLTIAIADAILNDRSFTQAVKEWGQKYSYAGYGGNFTKWLHSESTEPYNSWGNGSAMRVSPVGFAYNEMGTVLQKAKASAAITHNHPEGIKGAQAVAAAIFLAREESSKKEIREYIEETFQYDLSRTLAEIRPVYTFDVSCQGSVPEAIIAFLESSDFEDAIRLAISIGGDSDTVACMAGGIAQAYYREMPKKIISFVRSKLTPEMLEVLEVFEEKFIS